MPLKWRCKSVDKRWWHQLVQWTNDCDTAAAAAAASCCKQPASAGEDGLNRRLRWRCIEQLGRELLCRSSRSTRLGHGTGAIKRPAGHPPTTERQRQIVITRERTDESPQTRLQAGRRLSTRSTRTADSDWWLDCLVSTGDHFWMTTRPRRRRVVCVAPILGPPTHLH